MSADREPSTEAGRMTFRTEAARRLAAWSAGDRPVPPDDWLGAIAEIEDQMEREVRSDLATQVADGDEHPEARCERCGRPNVGSWHAPSPLWNAVMRDRETGEDRWGIVCPVCFTELAEASGVVVGKAWHVGPHDLDLDFTALWTDPDGRVWDETQCLWVAGTDATPEPHR